MIAEAYGATRRNDANRRTVSPRALLRDDGDVTYSADDLLAELRRGVPETQTIVVEHLADNDGLLLHLLIADLRRFALAAYQSGRSEVLGRLLSLLSGALTNGTEDVENAIAMSFVEDTGWWDPAMRGFIESWPAPLKEEARRQEAWRPA